MSLFHNEERINLLKLGIEKCPVVAVPYIAEKRRKISYRLHDIEITLTNTKEDDPLFKRLREEQSRLKEELTIYTLDK